MVNVLWYQDSEQNQDLQCERDTLLELISERQRILVEDEKAMVGRYIKGSLVRDLFYSKQIFIWNIFPTSWHFSFSCRRCATCSQNPIMRYVILIRVICRTSLSRIYFCNIYPLLTLPRLHFSPCRSLVPYINLGILILLALNSTVRCFDSIASPHFRALSRGMIHRTFSLSDVKTASSNCTCRAPQYFLSSSSSPLLLLLFLFLSKSLAAHIRNLDRVLLPDSD